jgi:hypothetical protein
MISVVYDQKGYHNLLSVVLRPGDTVIEIGPHIGGSTKVISEKAETVIAVDKAEQSEKAFRQKKDNVIFIKGDVRFFETVDKVLKIVKHCDVLTIDMGGGRFPDTVFKVWAVWSGVFKPRDSVIRNRGLGEFIKKAVPQDPYFEKGYLDSGWLSQTGRKNPIQLKEGLDELQLWMG